MKVAHVVTFGAEVMKVLGLTKEDSDRTRSIRLEHRVGELPTLTLEMLVPDLAGEFDTRAFTIVARECCAEFVRNHYIRDGVHTAPIKVRELHSFDCASVIFEMARAHHKTEAEIREQIGRIRAPGAGDSRGAGERIE